MTRSAEALKRKYGKGCFVKWGKRGGNELLLSQGKGYKITVDRSQRVPKKKRTK